MADNNQLQTTNDKPTLQVYFQSEGVQTKFQKILKDRAPQFLTSLLQVVNGSEKLQAASPVSIFNAAMIAATLDLPINPNLGFAWIVPYNGQAQFQIGYKGLIQLAQRSGQYKRIVTAPIYKNQFKSWDMVTETLDVDSTVEGTGDPVGYMAFFRLLNGYEKVTYWTAAQVREHGKRFSKSYNSNNSIWKSDFDKMAMKTVLKSLLSTWGILSIQMETAFKVDQAVIRDETGQEVYYPDNEAPTRAELAEKAANATADALKDIATKSTGNG